MPSTSETTGQIDVRGAAQDAALTEESSGETMYRLFILVYHLINGSSVQSVGHPEVIPWLAKRFG